MLKHVLLYTAISVATLSAGAVSVVSTPGNLHTLVSNPATTTELTLIGSINAADLDFIDTEMTALHTLDLSAVEIVAYSGSRLRGSSTHAAATIPARCFVGSPITSLTLPGSESLSIGEAAFAGAAIKSLTLGANVVSMGTGAFSGCTDLTSVTISANALAEGAFSGCTALTTVSFTTDVALPDYAFSDCTALATVNGSNKLYTIGNHAFANTGALSAVAFGSDLTAIGDEAFLQSGITDIDLSPCADLNSVGERAFAQMPTLKSIDLGNAVTVGAGVVFDCPALEQVNYSTRATVVPDYAYTKDTALDTVGIFTENISEIGAYALSGLSQVTTITLPSSLTFIGDHAMENMTGLQTINIAITTAPATGEAVWSGVNQAEVALVVPAEAYDSYTSADQWRDFDVRKPSGIADTATDSATLRVRFDGEMLIIDFGSIAASTVALYDIAGAKLSADTPVVEQQAAVSTAHIAVNQPFIVVAATPEGLLTLKIAKQ